MVNLHVHTEYSLLDGAARITDLVKRAKELGQPALAITDHGNMFGAIKFYKECQKQGIKPIIGCEVYVAERTRFDKDAQYDRHIGHLILLCKNEKGYQNLIKIVSNAYAEGFYYKPRTDKNDLRKYSEGLIATSACLAGKVQRLLLEERYESAKAEALEYLDIFGEGNFYLEVQNHDLLEDKIIIPAIKRLSNDTGIPLVATNDSHYVYKEDAKAQEILLCMQTKKKLGESKLSFQNDEFYLKSEAEMRSIIPYPEAIDNTDVIAEKCNLELEFNNYHIPKFDVPNGSTEEEYFKELCYAGFKNKYKSPTPELYERLEFEIDTIKNMGFIGYFLIVQDFVNWAKSRDIPVGFGRGSAAGSIVSYALGITNVDPVKYGLLFERFLNPERVSMPDIDIDFCIRRREEVINYVKEKYGSDRVCQIATFGTMKAKMAVRDVARVMEFPYSLSDSIAKMIPEENDITLKEALEINSDLKDRYMREADVKSVIDMAIKLEGLPRQSGTHAAGVVIAPNSLTEFIPIMTSDKGLATMYTMSEIEELGLLKMDFLGLRNLTVIDDTIKMIKERTGEEIDLETIDYDDKNIYEYIGKGKTVGIFQLESAGITDFMKKLKPESFEDIVAGVSLYRPGPMDSIPKYLQNKRHQDKIVYDDPKLEPILKNTYGCIVYQEQVMQIVRDLAGYSYGRSDTIRRAMSKKKADVMAEEKNYFVNGKIDEDGVIEVDGAIRRGVPREVAEKVFDDMESFARYAFNKSHSVAYSLITYQTAWLKYYYPSEFMAALMTSAVNNSDHLATFIKDARKIVVPGEKRKIKVLPPSVFTSQGDFSVDEDMNIRFGLYAIKNVGKAIVDDIVSMPKDGIQNNFTEFLRRINIDNLNSKAITNLINSGALNGIVENIHIGNTYLEKYLDIVRSESKRDPNQISFFETNEEMLKITSFTPKKLEEYPTEKLLALEKDALGTYLSQHPLDRYKKFINDNIKTETQGLIDGEYDGNPIIHVGLIVSKKEILTKKGERMAFLSLEALDGVYEAVVFPKPFSSFRSLISEGSIVTLIGRAENGKILVSEISSIEDLNILKSHTLLELEESEKILKIKCDSFSPEIEKTLKEFPGNDKVYFYFKGDPHPSCWNSCVTKGNLLMLKLGMIVGEANVK